MTIHSGDPLAEVERWPAPAAAGVTNASETLATAGAGEEVLPWASVSKLVTALAALVAVEEGIIGLDQPAGPPGSTVRHLLAHASGLPFEGQDPIAPPASRRIYSNAGFNLLGETVAEAAGMPFVDYLAAGVLEPLGMSSTIWPGTPSAGGLGPVRDVLALGRELLRPTLIAPETLAAATTVTYPGLAGILPGYGHQASNDWGLGFELKDHKFPHWTGTRNSSATFGHYGRSGSFLWVDPQAGLACAGLASKDAGTWSSTSWPVISDAVLAAYAG